MFGSPGEESEGIILDKEIGAVGAAAYLAAIGTMAERLERALDVEERWDGGNSTLARGPPLNEMVHFSHTGALVLDLFWLK